MLLTKIVKTFEGNYEEAARIWKSTCNLAHDKTYNLTCLGEMLKFYEQHPEYSTSWIIWTNEA